MFAFQWLRQLQYRCFGRPSRNSRAKAAALRRRIRPTLEVLEDRTLLSGGLPDPVATNYTQLAADITYANNNPGAYTITLGANIQLSSVDNSTNGANGLPVIAAGDQLDIVGNGYTIERSTASGTPAFRLFDVASGASLDLEHMTLQGGLAQGAGTAAEGGAVYSSGLLTLNNVTVTGNKAQGNNGANVTPFSSGTGANAAGGGLYEAAGSATLTNDTFSGNNAQGGNGGNGGNSLLLTSQGGALGVNGGNGGNAAGGGLYTAAGSVTLTNDTLSGNNAQGGNGGYGGAGGIGDAGTGGNAFGGGLYLAGSSVTMTGDTLNGNNAQGGNAGMGFSQSSGGNAFGGGSYLAANSVTMTGDTLNGNHAQGGNGNDSFSGGSGGNAAGGGLDVAAGSVTLTNDTLSANYAQGGIGGTGPVAGSGGGATGGGLDVAAGNVTLTNDTLSGNYAQGGNGGNGIIAGAGGGAMGGGLYAAAGNVTLTNDTLSGNYALGGNQALLVIPVTLLNIIPSIPDGRGVNGRIGGIGGIGGTAAGGGLYMAGGSVLLTNDTLSANYAQGGSGGSGGGGTTGGNGGTGGNAAGGGLYLAAGSVTLTNDTLSGNNAQGGNGGGGGLGKSNGKGGNGGNGGNATGGGVDILSSGNPTINLTNTLIAENRVTAGTGGRGNSISRIVVGGNNSGASVSATSNGISELYNITPSTGSGAVTVTTSTPAGKTGTGGTPSDPDVSGTVTSSDHDLIGDGTGSNLSNGSNGNQVGTSANPINPLLGALQNNGGATQTLALLAGGPAIDAGDSSVAGLPSTDQRGYARIAGNAIDIGAFEYGSSPVTGNFSLSGSATPSAQPGEPITYVLTVTNYNGTGYTGNLTLTVPLPANTTWVALNTPSGWAVSLPNPSGGTFGNGTFSAWTGSLAAGAPAVFVLQGYVNPGTPLGTVLSSTASIGPVSVDPYHSVALSTIVPYTPSVSVVDGGTYNGNPFAATGTALGVDGQTPVNGSFSYTYYAGNSASGTPLAAAPTNAGTYTVVATFTSSNPYYTNGSTQTTFFISPANLTVTLTDNSGTYNGKPFAATATATLNGSFTYNYSVASPIGFVSLGNTAPTDVGTYMVMATFTSSDGNFRGSAQTTFTISPATPTLTVTDTGGTYNGNPFPATATAVGLDGTTPLNGNFSYTYYAGSGTTGTNLGSTPPVNAGTYTVVVTFNSSPSGGISYNGSDYSGTAETTFTINPAPIGYTIGNDTQAVGYPADLAADLPPTINTGVNGETLHLTYSSSGDTSTAAAGTYPITATVSNGSGLASNYTVTLTNGTLTVLGPGATVVGSTLWIVGGSTSNDTIAVNPAGTSNTGSTGVVVEATLNGVATSTTYRQSFSAINIFLYGGSETVRQANSLAINTVVHAGDGNDRVHLGNGANVVMLGNGSDNVQVGNGNDVVETGNGTDTITAGNGNNYIVGGLGQNTVTAGNGNDYVVLENNSNNTVTLGNGSNNVQVGNGNNVVVTGNGYDYIVAGNGDNLIAAGLGQHEVFAGNGNNILIDGSVQLTQSGDSLRQVLNDWIANGNQSANVASIRSRLSVTDSQVANVLLAGSGLDWFWATDAADLLNVKPTDLQN